VIRDFGDPETQRLWETGKSRRMPAEIRRTALRKLLMLHTAEDLEDLRLPPGSRLEALKGDRAGQHSIRINDRYRICFVWNDDGVHGVSVLDYH
jgi:toxin HigB-1